MTLPHGGCTVEVHGCPCLELRQLVPPRPHQVLPTLRPRVSHPSPGPTPTRTALHSPGHRPHCSWLSPDLCCQFRASVPRVLGVLYPPISAIIHSGETECSLGSRPQFTLNTFCFWLYLVEFSEMCFLNLNCCFQKDHKVTVLNFKNKIFSFNFKVKLEGGLKAVIFPN